MGVAAPETSPIDAAAFELQSHHRKIGRTPIAILLWKNIDALPDWRRRLRSACSGAPPECSKAAEWLLDNHFQISRAIRQIREDMPTQFYRRLPSLEGEAGDRLPRIYYVALGLLHTTHLQFSLRTLVNFIRSYQKSLPLSIAELWAFPTMLRIVCLETLIQATTDIFPELTPPFQHTITQTHFEAFEPTERIARSLMGLRNISSVPWDEFFDQTSVVEKALRNDPSDIYPKMDFETRDQYRRTIEELAFHGNLSEMEVANLVLATARDHIDDDLLSHVGYWLVGDGRAATESLADYRPPLLSRISRAAGGVKGPLYGVGLIVSWLLLLMPVILFLRFYGAGPAVLAAGLAVSAIPASIVALTSVNWLFSTLITPLRIPKLNFKSGIPDDRATAVAMPVIVSGEDEAASLVEKLEMHWRANPDPSLQFVLLTDHTDAPVQTMPSDAAIEETFVSRIRQLNRKYGNRFHFLHRPRKYNDSERCWIAWERKRGKLEQFNEFILTGKKEAFSKIEGDVIQLRKARYVVTVDADTILPMGSAHRLVGALAHPLNQARFDDKTGRLASGFTIIQPRVEIAPTPGMRSLFLRFFAGDSAIDIYSRAVSDIYQDIFRSAVFVGKGIYDVAAFHRTLEGRVPENALLSHDLFEGAHGRVALASDIMFFDGYPETYLQYVKRWRRWIRGDWQLLPWLSPHVPGAGGNRLDNCFSLLDRWKIFDNLRRSVIPTALVAFVFAGWSVLPGPAIVWTIFTILAPGAYLFTDLIGGLARGRRREVVQSSLRQFVNHAGRWALAVAFLLYEAIVAVDAISRTLWRVFVAKKSLLRWTSAAHDLGKPDDISSRVYVWRKMAAAPTAATIIAAIVALANPTALPAASLLLFVWFISPEIAFRVSRPDNATQQRLEAVDKLFLRNIARRTWLFFEKFVTPEDNWLPPDNYQEDPKSVIAHRTSPTNIGMFLSSTLSAWDFGYISSPDLSVRIHSVFESMSRLERYRGHLLNWYDTRTLAPLEPRYVSTVDSGNLAACLITLAEGCIDAANSPLLRRENWHGLEDSFNQLVEALGKIGPAKSIPSFMQSEIDDFRATFSASIDRSQDWPKVLTELIEDGWPRFERSIAEFIETLKNPSVESLGDVNVWIERINHDLSRFQWCFQHYFPWLLASRTAPAQCQDIIRELSETFSVDTRLCDADKLGDRCIEKLERLFAEQTDEQKRSWSEMFLGALREGAYRQTTLHKNLMKLGERSKALAFEMDFPLLYDKEQRLFHIGYNVSSDQMDSHHYDLLATEARIASYFAIAKGDISQEHWRTLGRPVTRENGELSLLSWNGSMFEYLMPSLWMRSGYETLLSQAERISVTAQRNHAKRLNIPWGVSESGFAEQDAGHHYQYQAFGVPSLGLRRGLSQDAVIAPYASALALAVAPVAATANMRALEKLGLLRRFGFAEAADFTPERLRGKRFVIVKSYMAHHQGMVLTAVGNALHDNVMANRFRSDRQMQRAGLLLEERTPWELPSEIRVVERLRELEPTVERTPPLFPWAPRLEGPVQQYHLLGNGRFASWISESGAGALWWRNDALTRWRSDVTCENSGLWIYVRDVDSQAIWSVGRQPTGVRSQDSSLKFHGHMAEFHRRDYGIAINMNVAVANGDDLEARILTVTNETDAPRILEITSFGEVALATPQDDERHPAFSKLFVESKFVKAINGLLFTRRPHHSHEQPSVLLHFLVLDDAGANALDVETDRRAFVGRGGSIRRPRGVAEGATNTTGWTLDPVMALQPRITLAPRERRQLAFVTVASGASESAIEIAERYATLSSLDWAVDDALREATMEAHQSKLTPERLPDLQTLSSLIFDPQPAFKSKFPARRTNRLGQPRLWSMGISGDNPILLLRVTGSQDGDMLPLLIRAVQYWRRRLRYVDLVILRTGASGYVEPARERLLGLIRDTGATELLGRSGGIHLVFADQIKSEDKDALECAATLIIDGATKTISELTGKLATKPRPPLFRPADAPKAHAYPAPSIPVGPPLNFANGIGGFVEGGGEYLIRLDKGRKTPAPWANVIANDQFGCLTTESGLGFTWAQNSGENRLTPWKNDPVSDPVSEALYLRDEETGDIWTTTPLPAGGETPCDVRHGAGYTIWKTTSHGIEQEVTVFVPPDDAVKVVKLRLANFHQNMRRITATYYAEWLLGAVSSVHRAHVICEYDTARHSLLARNPWNPEFGERVAFLASTKPPHSITTDRRDFIGREGDFKKPEGLRRWDLGGQTENAVDSCAAFQVHLDIAPGAYEEVAFIIGHGENNSAATTLIDKWQDLKTHDHALSAAKSAWDEKLNTVQVITPDRAFDLMMNRWLLHQADASRIMARAGFYQAGGAIGFRDQLQDMMALLHVEPARVRAHIIDCAARQFEEGDVLHWWHPPSGRGVRTRCSDDLLWLPFVTSHYVRFTGDTSILSEKIPFLAAAELAQEEDDRYAQFDATSEKFSLFDHCQRALERGVTKGPQGLPLIGAGDWNDGMNRIGEHGKGESVWLAWFAIATLDGFADLAHLFEQPEVAKRWSKEADRLRTSVDEAAWDGEWYVRAFDDDGQPWGSKTCDECRIDSIAQSWAVLSAKDISSRARAAVASAVRDLVDEDARLVRLFWPPIHETVRDPGYIKAYPPGIRENGGQYSHAAAWLGLAVAKLGDGDGAWRIFDIINPVRRTLNEEDAAQYLTEPYVLAADVGGAEPHIGRGGWSWYTGAAAWTWRLGLEGILGVTRENGSIIIDPCLPRSWGAAQLTIKGSNGSLLIEISDPDHLGRGRVEFMVDGKPYDGDKFAIPNSGEIRTIKATIRPFESEEKLRDAKSASAD